MGYFATVYVKPGYVDGDGSIRKPFGSIYEAMNYSNNSLLIYLFPGNYDLSTGLTISDRGNIELHAVATGRSTFQNTNSISVSQSQLKLVGLIIEADTPSYTVTSGLLEFNECSLTDFNSELEASTFEAFQSGQLRFIQCNMDMNDLDTVETSVDSIIKLNAGCSISIINSNLTNLKINAPIIKSQSNDVSIDISYSRFIYGKQNFLDLVDKFAIVHLTSLDTDFKASFYISNCLFKNISRVVLTDRGQLIPAKDAKINFETIYDGVLYQKAIIARSTFINGKIVMDTRVNANILFANNTVFRSQFGISAIDGSVVEVVNTIMNLLLGNEYKDTTLPMSFPYDKSCFYVANGGRIDLSYSCLSENAYNEFAVSSRSGASRGVGVRFVDPMFTDPLNDDLSLQQSSPLIDTGVNILANYLGVRSDIGASETRRDSNIPLDSYFTNSARTTNTPLPLSTMDIHTYLRTRLKEEFVNINTSQGSVVSDLMLKPMATMLEPIYEEIKSLYLNQSLLSAGDMSEYDMDRLLANYFLTRRAGKPAFGTVRLYLMAPTDISVPVGTVFTSNDGSTFLPVRDYNFTRIEIQYNKDFEAGFYFTDVLVEAAAVENQIVGPYEVVQSSMTDPMVVKVANPFGFSSGVKAETNIEAASRAKDAITVRNLSNSRSVKTVLKDSFDYLNDIEVVGFGDPEMMRDVLPFSNSHLGGCMDVYVKPEIYATASFYARVGSDINNLSFKMDCSTVPQAPLLFIKGVYIMDEVSGENISLLADGSYVFVPDDPNLRFSGRETLRFVFSDASVMNQSIRVEFVGAPLVKEVNDFLNRPANRLICCDSLAKHFIPASVDLSINYYAVNEIADLDLAIIDYINGLKDTDNELSMVKLEAFLAGLGVQKFEQLLSAQVSIFNTTSSSFQLTTVTDSLALPRTVRLIPNNIKTTFIKR